MMNYQRLGPHGYRLLRFATSELPELNARVEAAQIWRDRYPVKSMAGERLKEIHPGWHGLAGDRRYAFLTLDSRSGLPWLSARDFPGNYLLLGKVTADSGHPSQPAQLWRGAYDAMDVSLITTGSLRTIRSAVGRNLESARFRPNILIDATATRDFPEEKWVGRQLGFGEQPDDTRVLVARKDERCAFVNFDPVTTASDPRILREVVRTRRNLLGAYALMQRPGLVRVDDSVWSRHG